MYIERLNSTQKTSDLLVSIESLVEDMSLVCRRENVFSKNGSESYRCVSQIRFYEQTNSFRESVAFYLECPDTSNLKLIDQCIQDRRNIHNMVVWHSGSCRPIVVDKSTRMFVTNEGDVTGLTINEITYGR